MRLSLILAFSLLSALPSRADKTVPLPQSQAPEALPEPAPQLMHLERVQMQKQEARDKGELPPEKYQEFIAGFRIELDAVMGRIPPTPENRGLQAQILARLGPQEQSAALVSLGQALAENPESPPLLVAKGSILYEQRDFQAADALALQAWEASGRKDQRAWALHKMSEGRISSTPSSEPAPHLRPASDFARLEWSIPERHDINDTALGLIQKATAARRKDDIAGAEMHIQAAMNADPTSKAMQDFYREAKAGFAKHSEAKAYLDQAVAAAKAGRRQDALVWLQKHYDRMPNDLAYEALQVARQRAAEEAAKLVTEPVKTPARSGNGPLLPILLITGTGLFAYGGYQIAKSKSSRTSDDGVNPSPKVAPDQARRNYLSSAAFVGAALIAFATWEFGPGAFAAIRGILTMGGASAGAAETLTPALAGGGMAGSGALISQPAAVGAAKAGLATAGVYTGAKTLSESVSYATADSGNSGQSTPQGPSGSSSSSGLSDSEIQALENDAAQMDPADKGGRLSKAGRSLAKHAPRSGSQLTQPNGSPSQINEQAARIIRDVLRNNPKITRRPTPRWGDVIDIRSPSGLGMRFTADGKFLYFIE